MEAFSVSRRTPLALPRSARLLSALPDEALVAQLRRGNGAAFEAIYDRHHRGILSFCRHMLGSREEGEDALQRTFISAYAEMASGERELKLKAWLYAIARNKCLSIIRARRSDPSDGIEISTAGLAEEVQHRADLREVLTDLEQLPEEQRAALVLSELGDLSHADVAAALGCGAPKVKSLIFQARSSLLENRNARETPCEEIREQLSSLRGGALRRGALRKHVNSCAGCSDFRDEVRRQRAAMALVLPVAPTLGLKHSALAAVGIGKGAAAAAGGAAAGGAGIATTSAGGSAALSTGAAAKGGAVAGLFAKAGAAKIAVVAVAAAGTAGGVAVTEHELSKNEKPKTTQRQGAFEGAKTPPPATPVPGGGEDAASEEGKRTADAKTRKAERRRAALRRAGILPPAPSAREKIARAKRALRRRQAAGLPVPEGLRRQAARRAPNRTKAEGRTRNQGDGGTTTPERDTGAERRPVRKKKVRRPAVQPDLVPTPESTPEVDPVQTVPTP